MLNRFELFTSSISGIYRDILKLERDEMETYGLRGAYAQYLLAMDHHPEGLTSAELCEVCDKDKAAVSRIVTEMALKGLIQKDDTRINPYRARLYLTEQGKDAVVFIKNRAKMAVEVAGKGVTDEERQIMYTALERIAANLEIICKEGIPHCADKSPK